MKGIELSEQFYTVYGAPMIRALFPAEEGRIAVGLAGQGSEMFGFDDEISRDHDLGPGFCLWLTEEDYARFGPALQRAYAELPAQFCGLSLQQVGPAGHKYGVQTIPGFFQAQVGLSGAPACWQEWFYRPEHALACAVNGRVFRDDLGAFSALRAIYAQGFPEDVRLKKIAGRLALMSQAGQYNYPRCQKHGEPGAARLALFEFVNHAFFLIFALNFRYTPFYKWRFRAMEELLRLKELKEPLMALLNGEGEVEPICRAVAAELMRAHLTESESADLEQQAKNIMNLIQDPEIRSLHLMECGEN